ncbi:hypothetical protein [Nocardia anaemiae]|uniref:hypothetical protein n=1 Tax=Nocardia anaemiae TaxID=263910 RepID=UPI0012F482BB|nr:hypothetical protein [Nocardia anaemiae]
MTVRSGSLDRLEQWLEARALDKPRLLRSHLAAVDATIYGKDDPAPEEAQNCLSANQIRPVCTGALALVRGDEASS